MKHFTLLNIAQAYFLQKCIILSYLIFSLVLRNSPYYVLLSDFEYSIIVHYNISTQRAEDSACLIPC